MFNIVTYILLNQVLDVLTRGEQGSAETETSIISLLKIAVFKNLL